MQNSKRSTRKIKIGVVISDKMDKTITVKVDRVAFHPVYGKMLRQATKFKVHDEKEVAKTGDTVKIQETRPLSKTKCWRLIEVVKKANPHIVNDITDETGIVKKAG
ncbi:MAG: 30S ribosomal protein S17 [Candidatus Omnitrophica bacterium]|nr:30S ribosomal protein S17 [Candidatus Omnitrophota bacterium]